MFGSVRRIGDTFDAVTAFLGASVAGVALFMPIQFSWTTESTPYRITSLINSVPRGAAIGTIVAVAVAVLATTSARSALAWTTALAGAAGILVNHFVGRHVSSAEMLTTQNYLDSILAGVLLGALGAAALPRSLPAIGFAVGGAGFFVFGNLAELLDIADQDPYAVLETPPHWLIGAAFAFLLISTARSRRRSEQVSAAQSAIELPVAPILAAMVLGLVLLAITEWLHHQYNEGVGEGGRSIDIGLAVLAMVVAAMAAAMLLPGRDGVGVYLAVSLATTVYALSDAPRPGWSGAVLLSLTALGLLAGIRAPSAALAMLLITGLSVFALFEHPHESNIGYAVISVVLALTAGYCCGTAGPRYAPSGVLAIGALYLPSIVTALPGEVRENTPIPGRIAITITIGCAIGILILHRFRPRVRPKPTAAADDATFADI